jgi:hypothetical protein
LKQRLPEFGGQRPKRGGVDHVAAGIPQQSPREVEVSERAAGAIARPVRGEDLRKSRCARDGRRQRHLVDKQHRVHELLDPVFHWPAREIHAMLGRSHAKIPSDARDEIHHPDLMAEDHERDDIAVSREVGAAVECVGEIPAICRGPDACRSRTLPSAPSIGERHAILDIVRPPRRDHPVS